ncbi:MAG: hypothetical protein ACREE7_00285, partial [Dongiaceae bacterium]
MKTACIVGLILAGVMAAPAAAGQIALAASKDNTLYDDPFGGLSNGAGPDFFCGVTANAAIRRAVIAFDLSGIPAGATINSVTLRLYMSRTIVGPQEHT